MSEESFIVHCSPTLAGLKTGNLFTDSYESEQEVYDEIRKLNKCLVPKGLRIILMKTMKNRALIYVYRPDKLEKDFSDDNVACLLKKMGYPCDKPEQCIVRLTKRLRENPVFPHEIGLFLGYPAEDVEGFIQNKAAHCKCVGCWKVYGDVEQAQKKFKQYKKCTDIYHTQWRNGFSIERLTVAV